MNTGFLGRDGFIWAVGVVEDRHDPQKMGRVKVRWLGYHTDDKLKIKTDDLPWSQIMMPIGGHSMSGVGESHPGIEEASWVIGFARDPEFLQEWIIMGTLPGMNTKPSLASDDPLFSGLPLGSWGRSRGHGDEIFGFFDPTTAGELIDVPFPPSAKTFRDEDGASITPIADVIPVTPVWGPGPFDKMKMYGDEILYGVSPSYNEWRMTIMDLPDGVAHEVPILTHTDSLFETFGTTRRLVGPPTDSTRFWNQTGFSDYMSNVNLGHVISTGYHDGQEFTYPVISEVSAKHRYPYPRMAMCQRKNIKTLYGPTMESKIEKLYDDEIYGNIKWSDVDDDDRVAIPTDDYNKLARGGIQITNVDMASATITTGPTTEKLQNDDVIMLSGIRGLHELNGRRFKVGSALGELGGTSIGSAKTGYTFKIKSADGTPISGPGDELVSVYSISNENNPMAEISALSWTYASEFDFSEYKGGGVVLTDGHLSIRRRAETREKWINIGHGFFVPEGKDAFGGEDRTQEIMTHYWSEPTSAYAAQYPYNKVYESESGHIMEYDDTPGAERINQMHRSGTYYEIDDSGNKTTKVTGDNHNLTIHDDYLYVKGKIFWTGDDEFMIRANDQMTIGAKWNIRLVSDHNIDIHAKGDLNLRGHNVNIEALENSVNINAAQVKVLAKGYLADTEEGSGYLGKGGEDEPFGGLIHLESQAMEDSSGRIVLKVPEGDPFADMAFGGEFAANLQLPGGAIVHEGGTTVDLTDSPKSRNTLQARVNFAFKAADAVTALDPGFYDNVEGDIGEWGSLEEESCGSSEDMTGGSVEMTKLGKPQTNPFAGSTAPALNENAEKIRNLHNEEVD